MELLLAFAILVVIAAMFLLVYCDLDALVHRMREQEKVGADAEPVPPWGESRELTDVGADTPSRRATDARRSLNRPRVVSPGSVSGWTQRTPPASEHYTREWTLTHTGDEDSAA